MNYKDTLLMPETDFAMRGNLPKREPQMQEAWEQMDLYNRVLEKNAGNHNTSCMTARRTRTATSIWGTPSTKC